MHGQKNFKLISTYLLFALEKLKDGINGNTTAK
jgi:hypothetical protein